jgi:hypothetical protein
MSSQILTLHYVILMHQRHYLFYIEIDERKKNVLNFDILSNES